MVLEHDKRLVREREYIEKYIPEILSGKLSVLDICTGPGEFLQVCEASGCDCIGIDRAYYSNHSDNRLPVIHWDARRCVGELLRPDMFDIVNIKHALGLLILECRTEPGTNAVSWVFGQEFDKKVEKLLTDLHTIMKPGAVLVIAAHRYTNDAEYSEAIVRIAKENGFVLDTKFTDIFHRFRKA